MSKSVKEWMTLLNESVAYGDFTDDDAASHQFSPIVGDCVYFINRSGKELTGYVRAVSGDQYKIDVDGELYTVQVDSIVQVCDPQLNDSAGDGIHYDSEAVGDQFVIYRIISGKKSYFGTNGKWYPVITVSNGKNALVKKFDDAEDADDAIDSISTKLHESVLQEAMNTSQLVAALALTLGLSGPTHAGVLSDLATYIETTAPKVGTAIVDGAKTGAAKAGEAYTEYSPAVVDAAKKAGKSVAEYAAETSPKVAKAAKEAGMSVSQYVATYYNEKSPEVIAGAKKLGVSTAEYIKLQTPEVIASAKKAGVKTVDYISAQYDKQSPAVYDAAKSGAKRAADSTGDAAENLANRTKKAAKAFTE